MAPDVELAQSDNMTGKLFYTLSAAIFLFMTWLLFYASPSMAKSEWRAETWITEYCLTYEPLERFVSMIGEGDETALLYMRQQTIERQCFKVKKGWMVAFAPAEIVREFSNMLGINAIIIRGNLVKNDDTHGAEAFVLAPASKIDRFRPDKAAPEQNGIRYQEV